MASRKDISFFEKYAHEYDLLTDVDQRVGHHQKEVAALIARFKPQSVLDAGCGTGLTAMLFARQGVSAVGLDRSRPMLAEAKKKYNGLSLPLQFRYGRFERLTKRLHGRFDLVVCLANSIAGVGTLMELRKAFQGFMATLRPGGAVVLQLLNYAAVKEGRLYPIRATEAEGIIYERFSERQGKSLCLYVTRLDLNQRPPALEVFRNRFDNFTDTEVCRALRRVGFERLHRHGNLLLTEAFSPRARDLVVTARRPS